MCACSSSTVSHSALSSFTVFFPLWSGKNSRSPLSGLKKIRVPPSSLIFFVFPPSILHSPPAVNNDHSFSHREKDAKILQRISHIQIFCSPYWQFLPPQFWKKINNANTSWSLWCSYSRHSGAISKNKMVSKILVGIYATDIHLYLC